MAVGNTVVALVDGAGLQIAGPSVPIWR